MAVSSHTGEFEEDDEGDSAGNKESDIFHRDGDHKLYGFSDFLFHGVSPFETVRIWLEGISIACFPAAFRIHANSDW